VFRSIVTMSGSPLQVRGLSANPRRQLLLQSTRTNSSALMWLASVYADNKRDSGVGKYFDDEFDAGDPVMP